MFYFTEPTSQDIAELIADQSELSLSYEAVGATKDRKPPADFPLNTHRGKLGNGEKVFKKAVEAVHSWQMYALGWTKIEPENVPVKVGEVVISKIYHLGFWSLNPCRIVYLINEKNDHSQKFGFAFGTLPAHSETGEEQFLIEWNFKTNEVFYEIYAFAKAHHLLAQIGSPYVTYLQQSFAVESLAAMKKFVDSA